MSEGLNRRELLKRLGAGAAVAALAGCPGDDGPETPTGTQAPEETPEPTEQPTETPTEARQEEVIDFVDAGADPNGEESVVPVLESLPTEDVVLHVPPGEYRMDQGWRLEEFSNFTIDGPEATIRPDQGVTPPLLGMGSLENARDLTIRGITFDFRGENRGPRPIHGMVEDGMLIENVNVVGQMDLEQDGMRFDVVDPDGRGLVRNMSLPDGSWTDYLVTGTYVGTAHQGHLTFESCHIAKFTDNGLYASQGSGRVDVIGGRYENSGISNVRVSGPATVRDVTVRCDRSDRDVSNMRGIRLRSGKDVLVRDCDVQMEAVTGSDGAITCAPDLEEATILDTTVAIGTDDVAALWAKQPEGGYDPERENPLQVRNVSVTGDAGQGATVTIGGRENALLENVVICQPGDARDGIRLLEAGETFVRGSNVTVSGDPLISRDAEVQRDDSTFQQLDENSDC